MAGEALTSSEYIKHHLQNLTSQAAGGSLGIAHSAADAKAMGFWALKSGYFRQSRLYLAPCSCISSAICRQAAAGVRADLQNFVEWWSS